jgi:hypothetical protein
LLTTASAITLRAELRRDMKSRLYGRSMTGPVAATDAKHDVGCHSSVAGPRLHAIQT